MLTLRSTSVSFVITTVLLASQARAQVDFVVPAGQTLVYDTLHGPIQARNVIIEPGAVLRVLAPADPLRIRADETIRIDGTLDLSGADGRVVVYFGVGAIQVPGGLGGPGSNRGGAGNPNTTTWSSRGGPSLTNFGVLTAFAALGGESGLGPNNDEWRRPGGGGGGALGPDEALPFPPTAIQNVGRIAFDGRDGSPNALGAESLLNLPRGGSKSLIPFVDGIPSNDFFGHMRDPVSGMVITGELVAPEGGRGGGAGGNAIRGSTYPPPTPWTQTSEEVGGGGGGGGGLGILIAPRIEIGMSGHVVANGGRGGEGQNTNGLNRIGGAGGGGSGGMLILQARVINLSQALPGALSALGGRGGRGANNVFDVMGAGGNGGPGLIQLHVPLNPNALLLPSGVSLSQLSAPTAKVLLPEPGL